MIEKINNHIQEALDLIIEQYKCSDNLKALIESHIQEVQNIEDIAIGLFDRLDINKANGQNLDQIGEIIGLQRGGSSDEDYRLNLFSKIGQNTSNGEPERVIAIFKLLSNSSSVMLQEFYPAGIGLIADGDFNENNISKLYEVVESILPASVRLESVVKYNPDCFFAFAGGADGEGFGSVADLNIGGCLANSLDSAKDFAFAGGGDETDGFGSLQDNNIGGKLL